MTVSTIFINSVDGVGPRGGALVETSGGVPYAIVPSSTGASMAVISLDGSATEEDTDTATTVFGANFILWIDADIDSSDIIHIVAQCSVDTTRDIAYCQYDTGTDTLGAWELVANYTDGVPANGPTCMVRVDSSDIARVIWSDAVKVHGTNRDTIFYSRRTGGTWDTPETVSNTSTEDHWDAWMAIAPSDDVEVVYGNSQDGDVKFRRRNGTWGTEGVYTETTTFAVCGVINEDSDTTYRFHIHDASIEVNNVDTTENASGNTRWDVAPAYANGLVHFAFTDVNEDVQLYRDDGGGGWELVEEILAGTVDAVVCDYKFGTNRNYVQGLLWEDDLDLHYWKWTPVVDGVAFMVDSIKRRKMGSLLVR